MIDYAIPAFYATAQMLILTGLGFFLRRTDVWPRVFFTQLSLLVVRVGLPAYFIASLSRTALENVVAAWPMAIAGVVVFVTGVGIALLVFRRMPFSMKDQSAGIALGGIGNGAYIPLSVAEIVPMTVPIVATRFGTTEPILLIGVFLIGFSPLLWSVGNMIVTSQRGPFKLTRLLSPPVIGILIGVSVPVLRIQSIVFDPTLPFHHVHAAVSRVGSVTMPLILIILGAFIADLRIGRERGREFYLMAGAVSAIRFIVFPALFYALYFLVLEPIGAPPAVRWVLFLQTHIPPATSLSVLASQAGINEEHTAFTLLVTNVLYLVVLPLYLILFLSLPGL